MRHTVEIDHNAEAIESLRRFKEAKVPRETLEAWFGYSGLSRYEQMLTERDQPKRVSGPEPKPAPPVIDADAVEVVKPAAAPKDPGLPGEATLRGDRW